MNPARSQSGFNFQLFLDFQNSLSLPETHVVGISTGHDLNKNIKYNLFKNDLATNPKDFEKYRKDYNFVIKNFKQASACLKKVSNRKIEVSEYFFTLKGRTASELKKYANTLSKKLDDQIDMMETAKKVIFTARHLTIDRPVQNASKKIISEFVNLLSQKKVYSTLKFSKRKDNYFGIFENLENKGITSGEPIVTAFKLTALTAHALGKPLTESQIKYMNRKYREK